MVSVPASPPLGGRCGCGGVWTARPCGGMDEADEMQVKTAEAARRGRHGVCRRLGQGGATAGRRLRSAWRPAWSSHAWATDRFDYYSVAHACMADVLVTLFLME